MVVSLEQIIQAIKETAEEVRPRRNYGSDDFSDSYYIAESIASTLDTLVNRLSNLNRIEKDDVF